MSSSNVGPTVLTANGLEKQLALALRKDPSREGSFAFGETMHSAPNPGLDIDSLGMIGLPLSPRDVESIKSIASKAPFGHGEQSIVDSTVRDTWEIDSSRFSLRNSNWASFQNDVVDTVWKGLGVAPFNARPRCELCKLLLYETGSQFLPHQNTEKVPGMFATIIIVLPSFYTGGEVRVVHGKEEKTFDYASTSQLNTSVLAWYADVLHEVKPITSGFRLALSYNLIQHGHTPIPLPLPGSSTVAKLNRIFSSWSEGIFVGPLVVICYKLEHKYSQSNLSRGFACLKGVDAHRVARVKEAAEGLGLGVCLGQLVLNVTIEDNDYRYANWEGRPYTDADDELDDYEEDESSSSMTLDKLVDLNGKNVFFKNDHISVEDEQTLLIPQNAFENEKPDEIEYNDYTGYRGAFIDKWYRRTALVLYLKKNETRLLFKAGRSSYAISQLQKAPAVIEPSQDLKKCLAYLIENESGNYDPYCFSSNTVSPIALDLALKWNSIPLWKKAASGCGFNADPLKFGWERVVNAWEKFGFEFLRPSLEKSLRDLTPLKRRVQLLDSIQVQNTTHPEDSTTKWCDQQEKLLISTLPCPIPDDVPTYFSIMKKKGLSFYLKSIMPQLLKYTDTYKFFVKLAKTLQAEGKELATEPDDLQTAMYATLLKAVELWKNTSGNYNCSYDGKEIGRIKELVECIVSANQLELLEHLFVHFIKSSEQVEPTFENVLKLVVQHLVQILEKHGIALDSNTCKFFFRWLIENYLQTVLGAKTNTVNPAPPRKIGCGCRVCHALDTFIMSTERTQIFREAQPTQKHLEKQLSKATDLVTYSTHRWGGLYEFEVTRLSSIVDADNWHSRRQAAMDFLKSIGGDDTIERILGEKFGALKEALSGERRYEASAYTSRSPSTKTLDISSAST